MRGKSVVSRYTLNGILYKYMCTFTLAHVPPRHIPTPRQTMAQWKIIAFEKKFARMFGVLDIVCGGIHRCTTVIYLSVFITH